jgi:hypothetical protein
MAGGQRLISCLHPCSTSNVALNTRTSAHGPLMGHPNWAGCDTGAVDCGSGGGGREEERRAALNRDGSRMTLW